jgi:hypothetical protein
VEVEEVDGILYVQNPTSEIPAPPTWQIIDDAEEMEACGCYDETRDISNKCTKSTGHQLTSRSNIYLRTMVHPTPLMQYFLAHMTLIN